MTSVVSKPSVYVLDDGLDQACSISVAAERCEEFEPVRRSADSQLAYDWLLQVSGDLIKRPDLIVIDWGTRGLQSAPLVCVLREHELLAQIPVVALSNSSDLRDRQRALELGCLAFHQKPKEFARLVALFRNLKIKYCTSGRLRFAPYLRLANQADIFSMDRSVGHPSSIRLRG